MVFNATFSNISVISWQSALLMEETELPKETHWPAASYFQTLSHDVASSTPRHEWDSNSQHCFSFYYDVAFGFIGERNLSSGRKTTDLMQVIDKPFCHIITKCCIKYTSPWVGIKITKLVHVCLLSVSNIYRIKAYKTSLTLPLFIEVPAPNQGSEQWCVCVLEVSMYQSREVSSHVFVC